jgi:hypothetical protein
MNPHFKRQFILAGLVIIIFITSASMNAKVKSSNPGNDDVVTVCEKLSSLTVEAASLQDDQSIVLYTNTFYNIYNNKGTDKASLQKYKSWFDKILKDQKRPKNYIINLNGMKPYTTGFKYQIDVN